MSKLQDLSNAGTAVFYGEVSGAVAKRATENNEIARINTLIFIKYFTKLTLGGEVWLEKMRLRLPSE